MRKEKIYVKKTSNGTEEMLCEIEESNFFEESRIWEFGLILTAISSIIMGAFWLYANTDTSAGTNRNQYRSMDSPVQQSQDCVRSNLR